MWEDAYGPIPKGHDIHHKDENWDNNTLDNFECLTKTEHRRQHPMVGETLKRQKKHLAGIRDKAAKWHRSVDGRQWHSEHARNTWVDRAKIIKFCAACGTSFEAIFERAKFCSKACGIRYRSRNPVKED
jgi:hypothetical protein